MQHFPKNCFHFPESSVKFASSTKNEVLKFGEVRSSSSTQILICNQGQVQSLIRHREEIINHGDIIGLATQCVLRMVLVFDDGFGRRGRGGSP